MVLSLIGGVENDDYHDALRDLNPTLANERDPDNPDEFIEPFDYDQAWMLSKQMVFYMNLIDDFCAPKDQPILVAFAPAPVTDDPGSEGYAWDDGRCQNPLALQEETKYAQEALAGFKETFEHKYVHTERDTSIPRRTVFIMCNRFAEYHLFIDLQTETSDPFPAYDSVIHSFVA